MLPTHIEIDGRLVSGTKASPRAVLVGRRWLTNGHWAIRREHVENLNDVLRWLDRGRTPWGGEIYADDRGDREFVHRVRHGALLGAVALTGWTLRVDRAFDGDWRQQPTATYAHLRGREVGNFLVLSRYIKAFATKRWVVFRSAPNNWSNANNHGHGHRYVLVDYPSSTGVFILPVMAGQGSNSPHDQRPPVPLGIKIGPQPTMLGGRRAIDLKGGTE